MAALSRLIAPLIAPVIGNESVTLFGHVVVTRAFAFGLFFGALAYLVSGVVAAVRRSTVDGAGIAFAVAMVLAVRAAYGDSAAPLGLVAGLVLLALGGYVASKAQPRFASAWYVGFFRTGVVLLPGALVMTAAFPVDHPSWVRIAMGVGVLVAGPLVHDFDAAQGARGAPFSLLAVSVIAVYYTVPDTELPLIMLGCAIPLALLSVPQALRRLGPSGSTAAVGAFVWVCAVGGRGRSGSFVAAVAALGLLVVEPLARRVPRSTVAQGKRRRQRTRQTDNWLLVVAVASVAQLALGAFCAKFAGRETDPTLAALIVAPALVLLGAAAPSIVPIRTVARPMPRSRGRHSRHHSRAHGSQVHRNG